MELYHVPHLCSRMGILKLPRLVLTVLWIASTQPLEVVEPGPPTGIVLQDAPGLLLTNCRTYTQRVYVRLDPHDVFRKHINMNSRVSYHGRQWAGDTVWHAQLDTIHMLRQLRKATVTQEEMTGLSRPKRFLGGLIAAASAVGSLFSAGLFAANTVTLTTLRRQVSGLRKEMPEIYDKLYQQQQRLESLGKTLQGTILAVNLHAAVLNNTLHTVGRIVDVLQWDYAYVQQVRMLMQDLLRELSATVTSLAMGQIPTYLVPLSLVEEVLKTTTSEMVQPLQVHLAYSLGSAIPIHVNPEAKEIGFLLNLPIVSSKDIYRLKSILNVGFWRGDMHVKLTTPPLVAYQEDDPNLYLVPNLELCISTKDIHWVCPSKPFLRDTTQRLCGIRKGAATEKCKATVTSKREVNEPQVEQVGKKWLVSTPQLTVTITYDRHDTATEVQLPNQTVFLQVPEGAIVHLNDLALYHLESELYETELEIVDAFRGHSVDLDERIQETVSLEGVQVVEFVLNDTNLKTTLVGPKHSRCGSSGALGTVNVVILTLLLGSWIMAGVMCWMLFSCIKALRGSLNETKGAMVYHRNQVTTPKRLPAAELSDTDSELPEV